MLMPPSRQYGHEQTWHDGNGHSHLQATVLGQGLTVPVGHGQAAAGHLAAGLPPGMRHPAASAHHRGHGGGGMTSQLRVSAMVQDSEKYVNFLIPLASEVRVAQGLRRMQRSAYVLPAQAGFVVACDAEAEGTDSSVRGRACAEDDGTTMAPHAHFNACSLATGGCNPIALLRMCMDWSQNHRNPASPLHFRADLRELANQRLCPCGFAR